MSQKLIQLSDGLLVEVEVDAEQAQPISGRLADKVGASLNQMNDLLITLCKPVAASWAEYSQVAPIESLEITVNLCFEGEGSLYLAKAKSAAHLTVKLSFRTAESAGGTPN